MSAREALADALHDAGDPCLGGCRRMADAFIASGEDWPRDIAALAADLTARGRIPLPNTVS